MRSALPAAELRAAIEDVVYTACLHQDELNFHAWLELTSSEFHYRIETYSPELRKKMIWLEHDRNGLAALIELLPKHHVNGAQWLRHATLYSVAPEEPDTVRAVTSVAIFHTSVDVGDVQTDGGSSRLFAIGRYHDRLQLEAGRWLLSKRVVKLETRQLGIGSHLIL